MPTLVRAGLGYTHKRTHAKRAPCQRTLGRASFDLGLAAPDALRVAQRGLNEGKTVACSGPSPSSDRGLERNERKNSWQQCWSMERETR
ncbi:hypothetical protein MRX96_014214 [Rhipicephalus microplus]